MSVEEHYESDDRDRDDGHAASVELRGGSGQLSTINRADNVGRSPETTNEPVRDDPKEPKEPKEVDALNATLEASNGVGVTAAAAVPMRLLPAVPSRAPTRNTEDEGLLRRAGAGDAVAFKEIFLRHKSDVARLVYRMLSGPSDLEDVVQEVFVQVFRSLKDFRGQSKFSTWLHRVTVNVVLMHRRSARSRPILTEEAPSDIVADDRQPLPDEDAERMERMRAFQRLLSRLAEKKRVVFVLHELEGLAPTEIAEVVGAPVLTVRTRLFYARRELEEMLGDEPSLAGLRSQFTTTNSTTKSESPASNDEEGGDE